MHIKADLHIHSIASGHHTSDTVTTLAKRAAELGLERIGITDHAPKMAGAASVNYFRNLKYADKQLFGVNVLYGAELNVVGKCGGVDLPEDVLCALDYTIASIHKEVFRPSTEEVNTSALVNAMKNPYVNIIGHPDDPVFKINPTALTDAAAQTGTALELNSAGISEYGHRDKNIAFLVEMLYLCKKKGVFVSLGSDSHGTDRIADFENSIKLLAQLDFPSELIINCDVGNFRRLVNKKRKGEI
ncbi:MAG: PHP domain-containing protein [Clostridia bacterium]|nr:PHP domain-containing protein [Clostridia bacterium]